MKQIIYLLMLVILVSVVFAATANYVTLPSGCTATDPTNFPGQDCSPLEICGELGDDIAQCFDTDSLTAPGSAQTSTTNFGSDCNGGLVVNCNAAGDAASPYCDNSGNFWCDRNSVCQSTEFRQTQCEASKWCGDGGTVFTCVACRSGFNDCDTDATPCEIQDGASCNPGGIYSGCLTVGSGGTGDCIASGSNLDCDDDDGDTDESTCNGANGCEILNGGPCTVSSGGINLVGTYVGCAGGTGNCVVDKDLFETGSQINYTSPFPFLWGFHLGDGFLMNFSNSKSVLFLIKNDTSLSLGNGKVNLSSSGTVNATKYYGSFDKVCINGSDCSLPYLNITWINITQNLTLDRDINISPFFWKVDMPTNNFHVVNKEYVDSATSSTAFDFFFNKHVSDLEGHFNMTEMDLEGPESTIVSASLGAGSTTTIFNWTTLVNQPEFNELRNGVYDVHVHFNKNLFGARDVVITPKLYNISGDGSKQNLLITFEPTNPLTITSTEYELHGVLNDPIMLGDDTRLSIQFEAVVSGGGSSPVVTATIEGLSDSHLSVATSSNAFEKIFIRRDGKTPLTDKWDTGIFDIFGMSNIRLNNEKVNISDSGDVNATKFYGDGSALTGIVASGADYPGYWIDDGDSLSLNETLATTINISNNIWISSGGINATGHINASGNITIKGNVTALGFIGEIDCANIIGTDDDVCVDTSDSFDDSDLRASVNLNWSNLVANDTQLIINISAMNHTLGLKSDRSELQTVESNLSSMMPYNKSVSGSFDFNGGCFSNGVTIAGSDICVSGTGFFANLSRLDIVQTSLMFNTSLVVEDAAGNRIVINATGDSYFTNGGNLGIGTASPTHPLHVVGRSNFTDDVNIGGSSGDNLNMHHANPVIAAMKGPLTLRSAVTTRMNIDSGDLFRFRDIDDSNAIRVVIESDTGRVGIGTASPAGALDVLGSNSRVIFDLATANDRILTITKGTLDPGTILTTKHLPVQIVGTGKTSNIIAGLSFIQPNVSSTTYSRLDFAASNGSFLNLSEGKYSAVEHADRLGVITFLGDDGTDLRQPGASIEAIVDETDETVASNRVPTKLKILTVDIAPIEFVTNNILRMNIEGNGNVGILEDLTVDGGDITINGAAEGNLHFTNDANFFIQSNGNVIIDIDEDADGGHFFIVRDGANRQAFVINEALQADFKANVIITGNVGIGTTTPGAKLEVNGNINVTGVISGTDGNVVIQLGS